MTDATPPANRQARRGRLFGRTPDALDQGARPDPLLTRPREVTTADWAAQNLGVGHDFTEERQSPLVGNSILASAARIKRATVATTAFRKTTHEEWQDDGWAMYDLVGELRFLSTTLAQRTAKARLYVGKISTDPNEAPILVQNEAVTGILDAIGDGHLGMSRLIERLTVNLFITGDAWLIGIPKDKLKEAVDSPDPVTTIKRIDRTPGGIPRPGLDDDLNMPTLDALEWKILSISEVTFMQGDLVKLNLGPAGTESITVSPDDIYMLRIWRSHPRHSWQADSPVRSSLPVLRELVGLTMHISAQVDSRLAGAGLLVIPQGASRAMKIAAGLPEDSDQDPFTEGLIEAMLTPIGDRSNASALVPLVATVPDDLTDKFNLIKFDKPLDQAAQAMREESIRRFALGVDAPPELLLGTADSNHWSAWLTAEEVVSSHIEPPLQLICDAITTKYLRPVLEENGMTEEQAGEYVVWYDVSELIARPNKAADALSLYGVGELSGAALRAATGFDEGDAPDGGTDPAIVVVLEMVKADPSLIASPGLDILHAQVKALLRGHPLGAEKKAEKPAPVVSLVQPGAQPSPEATPAPAPAPVGTPVGSEATRVGPPAGGPPSAAPAPTAPVAASALTDIYSRTDLENGSVVGTSAFPELRGSLTQYLADAENAANETDPEVLDLTGY
jgi:hypothetical protein